MSTLVLDTGALIAVERYDRSIWALLAEVRERGTETVIPTTVLGQAWRGGPRSAQIARLLDACVLDVLDEQRAKEVGVRLGARGATDVVDSHVVCAAANRGATVATSDPVDITVLCRPDESLALIEV